MSLSWNEYIAPEESMAYHAGNDIARTITAIAQRYIGDNPPHPPVFRVTRRSPIRKAADHRYRFPIGEQFPEMEIGQIAYAWGKLWCEEKHSFLFQLTSFGPVRLYHNGVKVYGSAPEEEQPDGPGVKIRVHLDKGWNHFVLAIEKGAEGCGALFGTSSRKNKPLHFSSPSLERNGEEGWIYSRPLNAPLPQIPAGSLSEQATGVQWLPERGEPDKEQGEPANVFPMEHGQKAYAWAHITSRSYDQDEVMLQGEAFGPIRLTLDGTDIHQQDASGRFQVRVRLTAGNHSLVAECRCGGPGPGGELGWGFVLEPLAGPYHWTNPRNVKGYSGAWLFLGPFPDAQEIDIGHYQSMDHAAPAGKENSLYWRTAQNGGEVRAFLENERFGRWNYPLGVTLYGLLQLGKELDRPDVCDYVLRHVEFATAKFEYSLWDRERYGAAGLNNQLSDIDSLDDCGSFGALMILAGRERPLKGAQQVADHIADYIMHKQDRLDDGALYRRVGVSRSMDNTMWCDDLYMSVPFLCRYAEITGNTAVLDDAARQFLLYKSYLYMPDQQIMSHVFDVEQWKPTLTPWGRGNGWVLFSLSELLPLLSEEHELYADLLNFYIELCEGYLRLQGRNGLWHQVLTDPESYEETSCTSMFVYAFARGIRFGWLRRPEPYLQAVMRAWEGIGRRSVDKQGNVYGVCRGSSYSFSNHYYKHELSWNLNDTHGIGIVILAGIEVLRVSGHAGSGTGTN